MKNKCQSFISSMFTPSLWTKSSLDWKIRLTTPLNLIMKAIDFCLILVMCSGRFARECWIMGDRHQAWKFKTTGCWKALVKWEMLRSSASSLGKPCLKPLHKPLSARKSSWPSRVNESSCWSTERSCNAMWHVWRKHFRREATLDLSGTWKRS